MQDFDLTRKLRAVPVIAAIGLVLLISACGSNDCKPLKGAWSNGEGQVLIFKQDSMLLWLTQFGSDFDTMQAVYHYDCKQTPMTIDFTGFRNGSYLQKKLFGIIEWSSDTSVRIRYEPGTDPSERPKTFDSDLTQQFVAISKQ